jgi:hypothetical protein
MLMIFAVEWNGRPSSISQQVHAVMDFRMVLSGNPETYSWL